MDGSKEKQGALGNFEDKTILELNRILEEQKKLQKKAVIGKLPDGGRRIAEKISEIEKIIDRKKLQFHSSSIQKNDVSMDQLIQDIENVRISGSRDSILKGEIPNLSDPEIEQLELEFLGNDILKPIIIDKSIPDGPFHLFMFDLETSGLSHDTEIVQISVLDYSSGGIFSSYCLPTRMDPGASRVTGLRLDCPVNSSGDPSRPRLLNAHNEELITRPLAEVFLDFCHFINSNSTGRPTLVAHNGHRFDFIVLLNNMDRASVDTSQLAEWILLDSLVAVKCHSEAPPMGSRSLLNLVERFCPTFVFSAHNAVEDCKALAAVVAHLWPSLDALISLDASLVWRPETLRSLLANRKAAKANSTSFANHSIPLSNPLAKAGFNFERIRRLVLEGGWCNFAGLLALPADCPRVSPHKPSLVKLFDHIERMREAVTRESRLYSTRDTPGQVCGFSCTSSRTTQQLSMSESLKLMTEKQKDQKENMIFSAEEKLRQYTPSNQPGPSSVIITNRNEYRTNQEDYMTDDESDISDEDQ